MSHELPDPSLAQLAGSIRDWGRELGFQQVGIADVDVAARQAEELGAQLFVRPRDIPGVGRFSVCGDPTGATFALYRSAS